MDAARIATLLRELNARVGQPLRVVSETGSTNDDAKAAAADGAPHGALFVADRQSRGRGRGGKAWHSPAGENVYMSLLLRPGLAPERLAPLSLVAGVALACVLDQALAEPRARIKWPNDIYVDAHKIAGILVEAIVSKRVASQGGPAVVIGVGVNVLSRRFPADFAVPPISLDVAGARELDRETLCVRTAIRIAALVDDYQQRGLEAVTNELAERDFLLGRHVEVGDVRGRADGIHPDGSLRVVDGAGALHAVRSGEVTWR